MGVVLQEVKADDASTSYIICSTLRFKLKGDRSLGNKCPDHTVRQREFEARFEELLDIRTANVFRFLNFDHTQDLGQLVRKTLTTIKKM